MRLRRGGGEGGGASKFSLVGELITSMVHLISNATNARS